jgi:hypothetical protein
MPSPPNENGVIPWASKKITPHTRHYLELGIKAKLVLRYRQAAFGAFHGFTGSNQVRGAMNGRECPLRRGQALQFSEVARRVSGRA